MIRGHQSAEVGFWPLGFGIDGLGNPPKPVGYPAPSSLSGLQLECVCLRASVQFEARSFDAPTFAKFPDNLQTCDLVVPCFGGVNPLKSSPREAARCCPGIDHTGSLVEMRMFWLACLLVRPKWVRVVAHSDLFWCACSSSRSAFKDFMLRTDTSLDKRLTCSSFPTMFRLTTVSLSSSQTRLARG